MATTPRTPATSPKKATASPKKRRRGPDELERAGKGTMRHLVHASADLRHASAELEMARQEATGGVRRTVDGALERLHEVRDELRQRAEDQTGEWQDVVEQAPEKVRREMARYAIRSLRTPDALKDLSGEIHKREAALGRPSKGDGGKL
jgi:hypothetical protein